MNAFQRDKWVNGTHLRTYVLTPFGGGITFSQGVSSLRHHTSYVVQLLLRFYAAVREGRMG